MTTDPRCPACGEPVGAQARDCLHCGAEFDAPAGGEPDVTAADDAETERDWLATLLDPDGPLDDSLTAVVAAGVAVVCAVVALLVFGTVAGGGVGLLAALVALVGLLAWLGRQYSVFGAVRGGCYALAAALVALPVVALTDAAEGGTFGGQVLLFVIAELLFGAVAVALVGIGYSAGKRRPTPDDEDAAEADAGTGAGDGEDGGGVGSVVRRE